jgi:hypothetical protein
LLGDEIAAMMRDFITGFILHRDDRFALGRTWL